MKDAFNQYESKLKNSESRRSLEICLSLVVSFLASSCRLPSSQLLDHLDYTELQYFL